MNPIDLQSADRSDRSGSSQATRARRAFCQALALAISLSAVLLAGCNAEQKSASSDGPPTIEAVRADVADILAIENRLERIERLARYLRSVPKNEAAAKEIVAGVADADLDRGDAELVLVAEWWTPFDPMAAFAWSRKDWRAEHPRIVYAVLRVMAQNEPQQAIDAYHTVRTNQETYPTYLQPIIVGWHESGRTGLIPFILSQPSTQLQQLALGTLARRQVLSLGPEKSIEWAESIASDQGPTFKKQVFQRIAGSIAELEPESAAGWVEGLVKNEGASETLLRRVSGRWARRDGPAAMKWLSNFEISSHQEQAVGQTFNLWAGREPEAARAWLAEQGDDRFTWLAPATVGTIKQIAHKAKADPAFEIDWLAELNKAQKIQDDEQRWGVQTQLSRVWITRDAEATRSWMDESGLPANYRSKVEAALAKEGMVPRS